MRKKNILKPWDDEDRKELFDCLSINLSTEKIAEKLNRTISGVYGEISRGGGRDKYDPAKSSVSDGSKKRASAWQCRYTEDEYKQKIISLRNKGMSWNKIARSLHTSHQAIIEFLKKFEGIEKFPEVTKGPESKMMVLNKILVSQEIIFDKLFEILQLLKPKD